jgi:hypothetical protein
MKETILLNGCVLMPGLEVTVKSDAMGWLYAETTPDLSTYLISLEQTYDVTCDYFHIKNVSNEPQIVSLKLVQIEG